jgi:hypothetical protein
MTMLGGLERRVNMLYEPFCDFSTRATTPKMNKIQERDPLLELSHMINVSNRLHSEGLVWTREVNDTINGWVM